MLNRHLAGAWLACTGGDSLLGVTGTSSTVRLGPDPANDDAFAELRKLVRGNTRVEIVGTIESPSAAAKETDILRVQSFTINP